jgi:hypothetical protein
MASTDAANTPLCGSPVKRKGARTMNMGEITALIQKLRNDAADADAFTCETMSIAADALAAMQRHAFNTHDIVYLDPYPPSRLV